MNNNITELRAIVLAAGKGTRLKSNKPKVLHEIFARPLLYWVLKALNGIKCTVVAGFGFSEVEKFLESFENIDIVEQKEQNGTGHAVMMCCPNFKDFKGQVIITCGDTPLIKADTIKNLVAYHNENKAELTVATAIFDNPYGYGRIVRSENGDVKAIVEEKDATEEQKLIKEVNAGIYCLNWEAIEPAFESLTNNNNQGEYYLTDIVSWAVKQGLKVTGFTITDNREIFGINSREQLAKATEIMKNEKLKSLMESGVTITDPITVNISPETTIGKDTIIYPSTFINGENTIGENCKIGPMAHLRGGCKIGDRVKIGNFVELKNAKIKSDTNVCHLTYVGDCEIGTHVNVGAGTITANYDSISKTKSKTVIENGASIGSNSVLVAPVKIGENCLVGAGSVITKDTEQNSLTLARAKQSEYKNWVSIKKEKINESRS